MTFESFIHPFHKYVMNSSYMCGIVLSTRDLKWIKQTRSLPLRILNWVYNTNNQAVSTEKGCKGNKGKDTGDMQVSLQLLGRKAFQIERAGSSKVLKWRREEHYTAADHVWIIYWTSHKCVGTLLLWIHIYEYIYYTYICTYVYIIT